MGDYSKCGCPGPCEGHQEEATTAPRTELGMLQDLALDIGAISKEDTWYLPFYLRGGDILMLPVDEWIRQRKVAAGYNKPLWSVVDDMRQSDHDNPDEGLEGEPFDMAKPEPVKWSGDVQADNWQHRGARMKCQTCMFYVPKAQSFVASVDNPIGRCREASPTLKGWPAVYPTDWCGAHKVDQDKL